MDPFVHLHVASGYSRQYGASHPHVLVERAAEHEMDTLALTDRDGTYGAVKHAKACLAAGVRPVLGVDLAVRPVTDAVVPERRPRTPVRGGAFRDDRLVPRVTFLADASHAGGRAGWAAVCRLVSAVQLAGERGAPVAELDVLAPWLGSGDVVVLLGPASEVGAALARRRDDLAHRALAPWREVVPAENLLIELVSHRLPQTGGSVWGPGTTPHAARMAGFARSARMSTVLTNAVRYADRRDAPVVDVLDAARRLVALGSADLKRHIGPAGFRANAEGFLKSGKQMLEVAEEIARLSGLGDTDAEAHRLLAHTRQVADRCALDPRADLGLGEVHFPEFELTRGPSLLGARDDERDLVWGEGSADDLLRARCEAAIGHRYGNAPRQRIWKRLDDELEMIRGLGYASYFLTVGDVTDLIREMGVRCAARGSGAGSLVNYLLGISGVDPIRHGLLMERFLSPLRASLPDIDIDVESARREDIYRAILDRYGGERCVCVSMMDTYRVRHAVRDVGAALGMPPGETDAIAKAFPHIRARDARMAMRDLPELRAAGLDHERLDLFFDLVERLDGLPRHIAVHPCGVLLSDATLLDRTPVEASFVGFPMSQFDKDDVEDIGLLKLDVLGIRMQSSMAHAVDLVRRTDGIEIDLDDEDQVPFDDPATFHMISQARTLGVFQIESPGQRELVGKSGIETFEHIITDISLFRPGPVKSDMITPYLDAKHGWSGVTYLHDDLRPILRETNGVVVFHEQVIEMIAQFGGVTNAEADEKRRALGDVEGMAETKLWFFPAALGRGYSLPVVEAVWKVIEAFASFGFCKAHAAAFALPTYQSAWLKAHYPAHFLAGVLTHDPGMYPKRLILEDARQCGIAILGLDVNASEKEYVVEPFETAAERPPQEPRMSSLDEPFETPRPLRDGLLRRPPQDTASAPQEPPPLVPGPTSRPDPTEGGWPDGRGWGIRLALAEVKGINAGEVDRIVSSRPYHSLTDFWHRAQVSRPIVERLVLAGAFDSVYGLDSAALPGVRRRTKVTRRDLLLQVAELDRHARAIQRAGRARGLAAGRRRTPPTRAADVTATSSAQRRVEEAAARTSTDPRARESSVPLERHPLAGQGVWARAAAQSRAAADPRPVTSVQLTLDLGDAPQEHVSGLPEMTAEERMRAELEILGLDASRHVVDTYADFLDALGAVRSLDLLRQRSRSEILVAGVKVATQTPPVRSGRRVVFLTLDDGTGPVDATFFEDAQGPYAATVFGSWLLVVRGEVRRTGHRGISLRATGAWSLTELHARWQREGIDAVRSHLAVVPAFPSTGSGHREEVVRHRVLVHSSGFQMSPYADVKPSGESVKDVARKLWHRSPGSPG
jgi:error-prone DNA polymerase